MTDPDIARARDAAGLLLAMARGGLLGSDPETILAVADLCQFVEESAVEVGTMKPRWRLLTDATRQELTVGSLVCVRFGDGREVTTTVYWPPGTLTLPGGTERGVVWLHDWGCVDLSQVIAVWLGGNLPGGEVRHGWSRHG